MWRSYWNGPVPNRFLRLHHFLRSHHAQYDRITITWSVLHNGQTVDLDQVLFGSSLCRRTSEISCEFCWRWDHPTWLPLQRSRDIADRLLSSYISCIDWPCLYWQRDTIHIQVLLSDAVLGSVVIQYFLPSTHTFRPLYWDAGLFIVMHIELVTRFFVLPILSQFDMISPFIFC